MKKIITYLLVSTTIMISSCSEYKKGKGMLQYKIVENKNTPAIAEVAFVSFSYTEATEGGKVLSQTSQFDPRQAQLFATMPEFEGDLQDAFQYLSEGDSAVVKVCADSIKRRNYSVILLTDTSKYIVYTLRINKVINREGLVDTTYLPKIEQFKREELLRYKASEPNKINHFLKTKKLSYIKSSSGVMIPSSLNASNNAGIDLYVNYTISSLDGKVYETNSEEIAKAARIFSPYEKYGPRKMKPEQARIPGLEKALMLIKKGTKTKIIIPSALAYGERGNNTDIPPYAPLLCEIEILNKQI